MPRYRHRERARLRRGSRLFRYEGDGGRGVFGDEAGVDRIEFSANRGGLNYGESFA
jgi:hypothetical protein